MNQTSAFVTNKDVIGSKPSTYAPDKMENFSYNLRKRPATLTRNTGPKQNRTLRNTFVTNFYNDKDNATYNEKSKSDVNYTLPSHDTDSADVTNTLQALKVKISNARRRLHHLRK